MLQVWLLMIDGNLENRGAANINITQQDPISFVDDGKVGPKSCCGGVLTFNYDKELSSSTGITMCCWVKYTNNHLGLCCFGNYQTGDNRFYAGITDGKAQLGIEKNSSLLSNINIVPNKWYHFALTHKDDSTKLYINGDLAYTHDEILNFQFVGPISIFKALYSQTNYPMYIQDYRLYDNALTLKEIKDISKALIYHFPLNLLNRTKNILLKSNFNITSSSYMIIDVIRLDPTEIPDHGESVTITIKGKLGEDRQFFAGYNGGGLVGGMFNIRPEDFDENGIALKTFNWWHYNLNNTVVIEDHYLRIYQFTNTSTSASTIEWITLVKGNKAPRYYIPTYLEKDKTEYNVTGYTTNGEYLSNSPVLSYDTARNLTSYKFNANLDCIVIKKDTSFIYENDKTFTLSCWTKGGSDVTGNNVRGLFGLGYHIFFGTRNNSIVCYMNTTEDSYTFSPILKNVSSDFRNNWHMVTLVYNDGIAKLYIDGVLENTKNINLVVRNASSQYPFSIGLNQNNYSQGLHDGFISDARLYATALSNDDVRQLYESSAFICNNNTTPSLIYHFPFIMHELIYENDKEISLTRPDKNYIYNGATYKEMLLVRNIIVKHDESFLVSFDAKSTVNGAKLRLYLYNNTSGIVQNKFAINSDILKTVADDGKSDVLLTTEFKRHWVLWNFKNTGTSPATKTLLFRLLNIVNYNHELDTVTIKNIRFFKVDKNFRNLHDKQLKYDGNDWYYKGFDIYEDGAIMNNSLLKFSSVKMTNPSYSFWMKREYPLVNTEVVFLDSINDRLFIIDPVNGIEISNPCSVAYNLPDIYQWHHYCITNGLLYIDGVLGITHTYNEFWYKENPWFMIGARIVPNTNPYYLHGTKIRDFRVYDKKLTVSEIQNLMLK